MKSITRWIPCFAGLCMLAATSFAQTTSDQSSTPATPGSTSSSQPGMQEASQTQQFYHARNLVDQEAKDTQGQKVGRIHDIVFNPENGETFAAISVGSGRYALVPWSALKVTTVPRGKEEVTLNTSKQTLQTGPTVTSDQWQNLNNPTFTQSIYSHYNVQRPTAMGGAGAGTAGGTTTGGGASTTNKSSTGQP